MVEIIFNMNRVELEKITVNIIEKSIIRLLGVKNEVTIGLTGGRSVLGIYNLFKTIEIPWERVHIFMAEERLVPPDDPTNNFKMARDIFIKDLITKKKLPEENVHPFIYNPEKTDGGVKDHESEFKNIGPAFDIILLSSGHQGEVAALFPYHHSVKDVSEYFISLHDSPKPPKDRMTISRKLLLKSRVGIVLFIGETKRDAFNNFKNSNLNYESCPAKLISLINTSFVITDLA